MKKILAFIFSFTLCQGASAIESKDFLTRAQVNRYVRIHTISVYDEGSTSTESIDGIDIVQNICSEEGETPIEYEDFADTLVGFSVKNSSLFTAQMKKMRYSLKTSAKNNKRLRSKRLSTFGSFLIKPDEFGDVTAFLTDFSGSSKYYLDRKKTQIPLDEGVRNVRFVLRGRLSNGQKFRVRAARGFSFDDINRCN